MRVMIAQTAPDLGALDVNIEHALRLLRTAHDRQVDLVVFPELSLTGQHIGEVHRELAMLPDDERLQKIAAETAGAPAVCVGFVEADRRSNLFNASAYCAEGRLQHVHRKAVRVSYDGFEEAKHFSAGDAVRAFDQAGTTMATLICNDAWHPVLPFVAVEDGAKVLLIQAASAEGPLDALVGTEEAWRCITRFYATTLQCFVVFANRAGSEQPWRYWGGSHVVGPDGTSLGEAARHRPDELVVDLDPDAVVRRRQELPLLKEPRLGLAAAEINRLVDEVGAE